MQWVSRNTPAWAQTVRDVTVRLTTARFATIDPELLTSQGRRSLVLWSCAQKARLERTVDALLPNCPILTCNLGCINTMIRNLKCHTSRPQWQDISAKLQEEFCLEGYDAVWVPVWNNLLLTFFICTVDGDTTFSETLYFHQTTRRHIPQDSALHSHHRDTLTSDFWEDVSIYDLFSTIHMSKAGSADITLVCTVVLQEGIWGAGENFEMSLATS
jgi:hypothetical protein